MAKFTFLIIFAVIGGLFWLIKTVAEIKARQAALEQYGQEDSEEEFDDDAESVFQADTLREFAQQEYGQQDPPPAVPVAEIPKAQPAPPPSTPEKTRLPKSSTASWISHHAKNAIIAQEILGPPKGTAENRNW